MASEAGETTDSPPSRRKRRWLRRLGVFVGVVLFSGFAVWWLMLRMPGTTHRGPLPAADETLTKLADELRGDVQTLAVEIGERNVGNYPQRLAQAADYLEGQFREAGYTVRRQEYDVSGVTCTNLEAELPGTTRAKEIVVVGAHYDSAQGTPGANDNASGVAATLALARRFAGRSCPRTVRFVAFTNEEPPYFQTEQMGSWVYARRCHEQGEQVVAMLSLETIGYYTDVPGSQRYPIPLGGVYPTEGNFIGFIGDVGSRDLVRQAVGLFRQYELFPSEGAAMPAAIPGVGFSDHWSFWQEGYPGVMVTDTALFRYPHYHTPEDTPDKIDFDRAARAVRGLERVVTAWAEGE